MRDYVLVEPPPDPLREDLSDLFLRIRREEYLSGMEDRPDACIRLRVEVQGEVACDGEDSGLPDVPLLVEAEEPVEEGVEFVRLVEAVGVVQADEERGVAVLESFDDAVDDVVEVFAGQRWDVPDEFLKDAPEYGKRPKEYRNSLRNLSLDSREI